LGQYGEQRSAIPVYADQFLYHIQLNPGKSFSIPTEEGLEYAVFLPQHNVVVNGKPYHLGDLIVFEHEGGLIEFANNQESVADIIFFGGEKYTEPFVAKGPFVMNTREEIHQANMDYQNGKYGEINYQ
jgi:redox-sensitive bicupin YhaK (pirin superfamily)